MVGSMSKSVMKRISNQKGYDIKIKQLADGRFLVMAFDNGHFCPSVHEVMEVAWERAVGGLDAN